jgi:hypothetical protein
MKCPNCGADSNEARKLVRASAKDLVESLTVDHETLIDASAIKATDLAWPLPTDAAETYRIIKAWAEAELVDFKDRMRANGYKTNAGPVRDARAAFRTHMRNAVKFAAGRKQQPVAKKAAQPERKDL